ncbi:hypothetical protein HY68_12720 [Streptomyces sp. AcH 505]|nr:hypothetical protein HY68_12720 [Streptomyces sp. AcH 505]
MTRLDRGSFQEVLGGGPSTTVPLIARPVVVLTAGRIEYAARCPSCQNWHRHVSLGKKTGPCGARYLLQPKSKLRGAA